MIPAIVLAAGRSTRMGRPKALLPFGATETFLSRIVRTFREADIDDVVIVLGYDADAIAADLLARDVRARFAINHQFDRGQLTSIIVGLSVVDRPGVAGALITLVDLPLVSAATVRAVVDRYRHTGAAVVRPVRDGRHGHPVLVDRALFNALRAADPAEGPKRVVRAHSSPAGDVEVADEGAFRDIDTPAEYEQFLSELE